MIVTQESFEEVFRQIKDEGKISLDTETSGLKPYQGSRAFSVIIGTSKDAFYFNFNNELDHLGNSSPNILPREFIARFEELTLNVLRTIYLADAKFDMHILAQDGVTKWCCSIHDVLGMERLIRNDRMSYSLDSVAKEYGFKKDDAVKEYIKEHKLWQWVEIPGKEKRDKVKFYDKVPFEIIHPYGEKDARITFDIGEKQCITLHKYAKPMRKADKSIIEVEKEIVKVCFNMEREGVLINEYLCKEIANEETKKYEDAAREFHDKTGFKFIDSAKCLSPIFAQAGFTPPKTDKGRDSFTDEWLTTLKSPLAKLVQKYRTHAKIANTYYKNFLWFADPKGYIHADMKPFGTRTGRFSYGDPNLQNVPDSEVRRAFVPDKDYCLVSIDYEQQEYRVMLDYAKQMDLIEKVKSGLDIHTATAELMGVDRKPAKTINFLLLYGGGTVKLCLALFPITVGEGELWRIWKEHNNWKLRPEDEKFEVTKKQYEENLPHLIEAQKLRELYFEKLPQVESFIDRVNKKAEKIGSITTWAGRRLYFQKGFHYKAPNALIQGGCADIAKHAMIRIDKFLQGKKSKMLIQVHDELNFKIHRDELEIIPEIKNIMEDVFPYAHLPLTASVSHSWKNWYDLEDGLPNVQEGRDEIQGASTG